MPCERPPVRISRERYEERRAERLRDEAKPRGRVEYVRESADPADFLPDGSCLAAWAREHLTCCRKGARRVLALVSLDRVEEAVTELRNARTRHGSHCQQLRDEALDRHDERWALDFDTWRLLTGHWHFSRDEQPHVDAANLVWNHRSCSTELLQDRLDVLATLCPWPIRWPNGLAAFASPIDWIDHVRALPQHPWKTQQVSGKATCDEGGKGTTLSSSLEDDNKGFSRSTPTISSRFRFKGVRRSVRTIEPWPHLFAPSDSFETVWKEVQWLAYDRAGAFRASNPTLDLTIDELIQVAMITVWEACSTFDGSCKFSTYVRQAITFAMIDHVRERKRGRSINSLDGEVSGGVDTDLADRVVESVHLQQLLQEIPDLRFVVSKVIGIRDRELDETNVAVRRHRALKAVDALEMQVLPLDRDRSRRPQERL